MPVGASAAGFHGYTAAYLSLIDGLKQRKFSNNEAASIAMELVKSYFDFSNNNKFADSTTVTFETQE